MNRCGVISYLCAGVKRKHSVRVSVTDHPHVRRGHLKYCCICSFVQKKYRKNDPRTKEIGSLPGVGGKGEGEMLKIGTRFLRATFSGSLDA